LWQADQKQQKIFQGPKAEGDFSLGQKESWKRIYTVFGYV
jgi:hypothetical protein